MVYFLCWSSLLASDITSYYNSKQLEYPYLDTHREMDEIGEIVEILFLLLVHPKTRISMVEF